MRLANQRKTIKELDERDQNYCERKSERWKKRETEE